MINEPVVSSKKITVSLVLGWIFGVFFALTGIVAIFSDPIPGIIMLIMAAALLPPINKIVDEKRKFHLSGGMKIMVIIIGFILIGLTSKKQDSAKQQNQGAQEQLTGDIEKDKDLKKNETIIEKQAQPPSETLSQKNAIRKAKSYLNYSAFSYKGLIQQLEFEQFSHTDAVYGTDHCGADRNEQASKKAKSYIDYSAFSRNRLIEQLKYDGFTQKQAEYGVNAIGL